MRAIVANLLRDFRYALRGLRNAPGYAVTATVTLAIGLGATTAMLAVVDSVLVRPVALPHAERIVSLNLTREGRLQSYLSLDGFQALQQNAKQLDSIAEYDQLPGPVTASGSTRIVGLMHASASFFQVAGLPARLGRTFTEADMHRPVALVSDEFWREELHGDPHVVGSTITADNKLATIIGVMPQGFSFPTNLKAPTIYTPFVVDAAGKGPYGFDSVNVVGRLKPGASRAAALAQTQSIYAHVQAQDKGKNTGAKDQLVFRSYTQSVTGDEQPALLALLGACSVLLLIACANSANLQIVRATARAGELALRAALGATRGRILAQIATESVTVSLIGSGLGLLLAAVALHATRTAYGKHFPRFDELSLSPAVFAACALLAVVTGLLAALAPSLTATRAGLPLAHSRQTTRRNRPSSAIVIGELALTCVLLSTAGLFLRTFQNLEHRPFGFTPQHLTAIVTMPVDPNQSSAAQQQIDSRLVARLSTLPGVDAAAFESSIPFSNFTLTMNSAFRITGKPARKGDAVDLAIASPGFLQTLGIPHLQGSGLAGSNDAAPSLVCVVNQSFVRRYLAGSPRVVGAQIQFIDNETLKPDNDIAKGPLRIVGIVPDQLQGQSLDATAPPTLYMDYREVPVQGDVTHFAFGIAPQFAVRSSLPQATLAKEIRTALQQEAPGYAEMEISPVDDAVASSLSTHRLALRLASGFGFTALILAAIGTYGVLAYMVAQRTREIGIRMALGSPRSHAIRLVLRQAAVLAVSGVAIGIAAAWPAGYAVRSFLFGVPAFDLLTLCLTGVALLLVCALAASVPAQRATRVQPTEALRSE